MGGAISYDITKIKVSKLHFAVVAPGQGMVLTFAKTLLCLHKKNVIGGLTMPLYI